MRSPLRALYYFAGRMTSFFLRDPALFMKYIAVGGLSALIEFSLFSIFLNLLRLPLLTANSLALAITILVHFNLQRRWTFNSAQALRRQLPLYGVMILVSALLNNALIYLFVVVLEIPPAVAKVTQIGLVFGWSFSFSKLVVFSRKIGR